MFTDSPRRTEFVAGSADLPALEPVANRPIAHHVFDALFAGGVEELVVLGSADVLIDVRASLDRYPRSPAGLEFAVCRAGSEIADALRAAVPFVGAAPCVVHLADGLLGEPLMSFIDEPEEHSADLVLLCERASEGEASGMALGPRVGRTCMTRVHSGDAGIGVFGPGAFRQACLLECRAGASSLNMLAEQLGDDGGNVEIRPAKDWHRYSGDPDELLKLNRLALDRLTQKPHPATGTDENRLEGLVDIDPTATVSASIIVGPVIVGPGAEVCNAYIGPYTSIGARARIEGAEIERSIISPGAHVTHVGGRLMCSLVGGGARVFRDFSLPRAMRLRISQGGEVALC